MKLKYYLRGLGAGIIFTALIFSFIVIPRHTGMSDEEIKQKAKELGMVEQDDKETEIDSDSWKRKPTLTPTTAPSPTPTTAPSPTPTTAPSPTPTTAPSPTPTTAPSPTAGVSQGVVIEVVRGMSSEAFVNALINAGIIDNFDEFNTYLIKNNYAEYIRIGSYTLKKGMTYQEIAETVTIR